MLILNSEDIARCFSMDDAVDVQREAFRLLASNSVVMPERMQLEIGDLGTTLVMPSSVSGGAPTTAVKVVSVFPDNHRRGLAPINGAVLVVNSETGVIDALIDGAAITALRTAAASALATDLLARPEARSLAIIGAGTQGRSHVRAISCVRRIESIRIYSRTEENARLMAEEIANDESLVASVEVAQSAAQATEGADIICTTTTSRSPVIESSWVASGAHVNAVGTYKPDERELPTDLVARSRVFVDSLEAAMVEAGDILVPLSEGAIDATHVAGSLAQLVVGAITGRSTGDEVTVFKSVGLAAQDAVTAARCLAKARSAGVGTAHEF